MPLLSTIQLDFSVASNIQDNRNHKIAYKDAEMCALVSNESAVSEFNNALRIHNDYHFIWYIIISSQIVCNISIVCIETLKTYCNIIVATMMLHMPVLNYDW